MALFWSSQAWQLGVSDTIKLGVENGVVVIGTVALVAPVVNAFNE